MSMRWGVNVRVGTVVIVRIRKSWRLCWGASVRGNG